MRLYKNGRSDVVVSAILQREGQTDFMHLPSQVALRMLEALLASPAVNTRALRVN